jgi:hypothetical protein
MKKLIFIILMVLSNTFTAQECDFLSRNGNEKPNGFYINRPNPFSSTSFIEFELPDSAKINIQIYDAIGKEILNASCGLPWGKYVFNWESLSSLPSGVYTFKLIAITDKSFLVDKMYFECEKKVILVK